MKRNQEFELVEIAGEHIAVPIGEGADVVHGLVILNDASAFLLTEINDDTSVDDLVALLKDNYEVDVTRAREDVKEMLGSFKEMGLIID